MFCKSTFVSVLIGCLSLTCSAQDDASSKPAELEMLQAYVGVWDAEIEVWPQGLDAPSISFTGVETNRAYGEHWIASDFDSEFMGQVMKVHSIVGYDRDQKKMVGTVIDDGPYSATMTGDYDAQTKTISWMTSAKAPNGTSIVQKTVVTQKSADERLLVLSVPGSEEGEFKKFMQIRFVKRK